MKLKKIIYSSEYIRNISVIASGASVAQIATIAAMPILTRQYSIETFGIVGALMAIVGLLSTISSGRYSMSIMLPKNSKNTINLLVLALSLQVAFVVVCLSLIPFADQISSLISSPGVERFVIFVPLLVLLASFNNSMEYWLSKQKKFIYMSVAVITASLMSNLWKIVFGFYNPTTMLMIGGNILNLLLPLCVYLYFELKPILNSLRTGFSLSRIIILAKRYSYFPKYRAPKDLLNSATQNAPVFLLATFFTATEVGLYVLADRILRMPSALIGQAVRKVFYQRASEIYSANDNRSLFNITLKSTLGLVVAGCLIYVFVFAFGSELFSLVFGERWAKAGDYASWIAVWMFFVFIGVPSVVVIPVIKIEGFSFIFEMISIITTLAILVFGSIVLKNDIIAISMYALTNALLHLCMIVYVHVYIKRQETQ